jgi:hypothetical protein
MRQLRLILMTSLITALAAGLGVIVGSPGGSRGRFVIATVFGTLGVLVAVRVVVRLGWFDVERRRGGSIGGMVGLALATPLVSMQPESITTIAAAALLVGVGVLVAAGRGASR